MYTRLAWATRCACARFFAAFFALVSLHYSAGSTAAEQQVSPAALPQERLPSRLCAGMTEVVTEALLEVLTLYSVGSY